MRESTSNMRRKNNINSNGAKKYNASINNGVDSTALGSSHSNPMDDDLEEFDETIMLKNKNKSIKTKKQISGLLGYDSDEDYDDTAVPTLQNDDFENERAY